MKNVFAASAMAVLLFGAAQAQAKSCDLLADQPAIVGTGFKYVEGPTWNAAGYWVFSDIPANTIYRFDGVGAPVPYKQPSGYANGNAFDAQGNLWSAQHDRKVTQTDASGVVLKTFDTFGGRRLNSPNDVTVARDGAVWFTDPTFGISGYGPQTAPEEQPVRGIYRIANGRLALANGELKQPNGIAFAPDGRSLFVADTADGVVYRFGVSSDGALSDKTRFASVPPNPGQEPMADGVRVDEAGRVWVAGPQSIGIFDDGGKVLCRIAFDVPHVANLAFGGKDGRSLLVTASDRLLLLRLK